MMTREYPPEVYGGAGVHVTELVRFLRDLIDVDVHCMGAPREGVFVHPADHALTGANPALTTMSADLSMANATSTADVLHSHTWYTGLAGHTAALLHGLPHIVTAHSLEPLRPWKAEQLGGGYRVSSWIERTAMEGADAVIAVSHGMAADVRAAYPAIDPERIHVVHNGIDTDRWYPDQEVFTDPESPLTRYAINPERPIVTFVGRITRQKGLRHLIAAAHGMAEDAQIVLCAGAPDTPEIAAETEAAVAELASARNGVIWIKEMLPQQSIRQLLTASTVFVCPSVYEPLGIVNLEAMACGVPVVASDVGGIPEVVDNGVTGALVHYDEADTASFERDLTAGVNAVLADRDNARAMGARGRERAIEHFSWAAIAEQTRTIYESVLASPRALNV